MNASEECLICKAPLEYFTEEVEMECCICHKKEMSLDEDKTVYQTIDDVAGGQLHTFEQEQPMHWQAMSIQYFIRDRICEY